MELSAASIGVLGGLLEARTGQRLAPGRHWRIEAALRPILAERELDCADALVGELVRSSDSRLADRVVNALLNNESYFFRDRPAFLALIDAAFERVRRERGERRRMRIWSAGCSTGQEAYSIAIRLAEQHERWRGWTIDILGTDVSAEAVARASEARYSQFEIQRGLGVAEMLRWFAQEGQSWRLDERIRGQVRFRRHNLLDPPPPGFFDLILCRNVLLYFPHATRARAFERLAGAIDPMGALMLGAGETILGQTDRFEVDREARGLYRAARSGAGRRAIG